MAGSASRHAGCPLSWRWVCKPRALPFPLAQGLFLGSRAGLMGRPSLCFRPLLFGFYGDGVLVPRGEEVERWDVRA